jgi:CBS domain-containing protein
LFVDVARILALAEGVDAVSTIDRLRLTSGSGDALSGDAASKRFGFMALQSIRLRSQCAHIRISDASNRIVPEQLNEFDRRVLLESLRQARGLQRQLKVRFDIQS